MLPPSRRQYVIFTSASVVVVVVTFLFSHSFLAQYLQIPESALLLFPHLLPSIASPPLPLPSLASSYMSRVQSVPPVFITLLTQIKGVTGDVRNVAALPRLD